MRDLDNAQRLHPLTLLLRALVSVPALIFILLPVFSGRSADTGIWINIFLAVIYGIFFLPWVVVYFLRFKYWITDRELIIHSGVLTRRRRNIPVDRIQNIDIEQGFLPRMLGAAKVLVYTAGSTTAEGVLEYVSLAQAQQVRAIIRSMQESGEEVASREEAGSRKEAQGIGSTAHSSQDRLNPQTPAPRPLFTATPQRAFLVGMYRFSLLYIAAMFSLLQLVDSDPMVVIDWLLRGPLQGIADDVREAPGVAAAVGGLGAVFLGWSTGILVAFNRYYGFHLELEGDQLHRRYGLLTRNEGTIPLRRIQSYIVRSNPLMKYFGWYRLELQTIGINQQESGFHVAAPMVRQHELVAIMDAISDGAAGTVWDRLAWQQVSPLTSRRFMIRWTVALGVAVGAVAWWWQPALWALAVWPLIPLLAVRRYANMGWSLDGPYYAVRRGVVSKHDWILPVAKLQVAFLVDNWFQRRLGLASVLVDTAGASEGRAAEVVDLHADVAQQLVGTVYGRYGALSSGGSPSTSAGPAGSAGSTGSAASAFRSRSEQSPRYNTAGTVLR